MRYLPWLLAYVIVAVATMPLFVRVEWSKLLQRNPELLTKGDTVEVRRQRSDAAFKGIWQGMLWPVMGVVSVVWVLIHGLSFGVPKELQREMDRREARQIIADFEKELEEKKKKDDK